MSPFYRIVFLGSPDFAVPALQALIESEQFKPVLVITQPDRPAGRNQQLMPTPVKQLALQHELPVLQPEDINHPDSVQQIAAYTPDLLVTVAYGEKLKKAVRNIAPHGAINLHPSLLPALRGAAPVPFAMWATGITIFKLVSRMDAGPIFQQKRYFIFPSENGTELLERLAYIGAQDLLEFLTKYFISPWEPTPQDETKATYCRKLEKADCRIDWKQPAIRIKQQICALSYTPGAYSLFRGFTLKILTAQVYQDEIANPLRSNPEHGFPTGKYPLDNLESYIPDASLVLPGTITAIIKNTGFVVSTCDGKLLITHVQPAGKKLMTAWAYHLGARLVVGESFADQ
jgi:methionyl-tRNA formyltransferase